jgi:hypothetical protein
MSVVDLHRWDRNKRAMSIYEEDEVQGGIIIQDFSDKICANLMKLEERKRAAPRIIRNKPSGLEIDRVLIRIVGPDGKLTKRVTGAQRKRRRNIGNSYTHNCWICRKYLNADTTVKYQTTTWRCKDCHMPLCKQDRSKQVGREASCYFEHFNSDSEDICCSAALTDFKTKTFPTALQINQHPRTSNRKKTPPVGGVAI